MPLTPPAAREAIHHRDIRCRGYRREDGLWDIEGHLVDHKTYGFENRARGWIEPGEPIHEMWVRLTIDEDLLIHAAEAATDHSPYPMCPDITDRFGELAGLRIGAGWTRDASRMVGGVRGCTHLYELLRPLATAAYQTLVGAWSSRPRDPSKPPKWLDTCHAHARTSPVVLSLWPAFYTGPDPDTARR